MSSNEYKRRRRRPDERRLINEGQIRENGLDTIIEEGYSFYHEISLKELEKHKSFPYEKLDNEVLQSYLDEYNATLVVYDDLLFLSQSKGVQLHTTPEEAAKLDLKELRRKRDKLAKELKEYEFEKKKRNVIDSRVETLLNKVGTGTATEEDLKVLEAIKTMRETAMMNGPGETKPFIRGIEKRTKNIEEAYEEMKALGGHMSQANISNVINVGNPGKPSINYLNYEFPEQTTLKNPLEPEFGIAERWAEKVKQNGIKFPRDNPTPQLVKGTFQDYTPNYYYSMEMYDTVKGVKAVRKASEKRENLTSKTGVLEKDLVQKDVKVEATQTIKEVLDADKNLMKVDLYDSKGAFSGTGYYKKSHKKDYYVKNPHYTNILDKNGVPVTKGEFFEKRMVKGEAQYREIKAMTIDNKLVNTAESSVWKPITEIKEYFWDVKSVPTHYKPTANAYQWRKREEAILRWPIKDYETALQELYKKELEDVLKLYKEAVDNNASQSKIYMLEENIDMFTKKMEKTQKDWTSSLLYNTYKDSIAAAEAHLASMGLKRMGILPDDAIKRVLMTPWAKDGVTFNTRIWKNQQKMKELLSQTLQTGLARGYSVDKMSVVMRDAFGVGFNQARRLIRTESMHFMNQGHLDSYKRHGIEYVEYVATDDDLCCADCEEMDGQIIAVSDLNYDNQPPLHPNCRCTLAPVIAEDIGETN